MHLSVRVVSNRNLLIQLILRFFVSFLLFSLFLTLLALACFGLLGPIVGGLVLWTVHRVLNFV